MLNPPLNPVSYVDDNNFVNTKRVYILGRFIGYLQIGEASAYFRPVYGNKSVLGTLEHFEKTFAKVGKNAEDRANEVYRRQEKRVGAALTDQAHVGVRREGKKRTFTHISEALFSFWNRTFIPRN